MILDEKRMAVYNKLDGGFTDRELYRDMKKEDKIEDIYKDYLKKR